MAYAPTDLGHDPKYDLFLYAPAGEDRRGTSVTVLSMLARLGVDPWREAADLAALPDAAARIRLSALLARSCELQPFGPDQDGLVPGLLAFLPRPATATRSTPERATAALPAPQLVWIIGGLLFLGWVATFAQGN
jgi:hypothetical protein